MLCPDCLCIYVYVGGILKLIPLSTAYCGFGSFLSPAEVKSKKKYSCESSNECSLVGTYDNGWG